MNAVKFFQKMQQAMDDRATEVWDMVEYSRASGYRLRLGEVTLTELNFYRLRDFWTKGVFIDTNEPNEASTGADWEWIIGHGSKWVQIRVQAKIIDRSGSYKELGHPPKARGQQMKRLIDPPSTEVACRWMPLYVFYSADPPAKVSASLQRSSDRRFGCSAKLAHKVRDVYGPHRGSAVLTAKQHLPGSVAWSTVFDGLVRRLVAGEDFAAIIDNLAIESFVDRPQSIDDFWDEKVTDGPCRKNLPVYLQKIIAQQNDDFDNASLARLEVRSPRDSSQDSEGVKLPDTISLGRALTEDEIKEFDVEGDSLEPLPTRTVERGSFGTADSLPPLPKFVVVMDTEKLPDI